MAGTESDGRFGAQRPRAPLRRRRSSSRDHTTVRLVSQTALPGRAQTFDARVPWAGAAARPACLATRAPDTLRSAMELSTQSPSLPSDVALKSDRLGTWLRANAPVAIGFSGGVDSAYLAVAARQTLGGERVLAIIG